MTRRSAGRIEVARSLWYAGKGKVELRQVPLAPAGPGSVQVRTHFSGVSRGTERLILEGLVPESERERMRLELQEGAFPFPVKYGYSAAGVVDAGPDDLIGRGVFCLHPHQDVFQVPADKVVPVPDGVPLRRATLAANMETALNAVWDSGAGAADRIAVVGAGIVGLLVAFIAARMPGSVVTVIDPQDGRREIAEAFGARFALPPVASPDNDIVFHTSASETGFTTAISCAGFEATIVELSWYGDKRVAVALGGAFHSQRLRLISSQVGTVAGSRRARWTYRRRMDAALALLADPVLDRLLATEIALEDAPAKLPRLLGLDAPGLAPVIRYPAAG
ncbi:MAG: zinc-binding alcohol dehydrogenase [Hyphomicrobiaceae bacterium]